MNSNQLAVASNYQTTPKTVCRLLFARLGAVLPIAALAGILACTPAPPDQDAFSVGMSREHVVQQFGEPDDRQSFTKTTDAIFGPIETFWGGLETGAKVEIWSYEITGGSVELYFVNDSASVDGVGFAPEDVVY